MDMPQNLTIADSTLVYLTDYETNSATDSAFVVDGKASISVQAKEKCIRRVYVVNTSLYANIIVEPGNLVVDFKSATATGTKQNDEYDAYRTWIKQTDNFFGDEYDKIRNDASLSMEDKMAESNLLNAKYFQTLSGPVDSIIGANKAEPLGRLVFWEQIINNIASVLTHEQYEEKLSKAGDYIADYVPIKKGTETIRNLAKTGPGTMFVDFTIENGNIDGSSASFSDYVGNGKLILVDFWASWCGPCRRAIPYIRDVYTKYAGEKFDILSVAVWDNRELSIEAINELDMPWNHIVDAESIPTDIYGIDGIPHIMLIGPDGKIIARGIYDSALDLWVKTELQKLD